MPYRRPCEPRTHVSPEDAARILRMNVHTLYRALRRNEIPNVMVGPMYRIPVEWLLMEPVPASGSWFQLELSYDWPKATYKPKVKTWRNVPGKPVTML